MKTTVIGFSDQETLKIALSPTFFFEIYREKIEIDQKEPLIVRSSNGNSSEFQSDSKYNLLLDFSKTNGLEEFISLSDYENRIVCQPHLKEYNYRNYLQAVKEDIESWFLENSNKKHL